MSKPAHCRSCGAQVLWAKTSRGKNMPLDPDPTSRGNIRLDDENRVTVVSSDMERLLLHSADVPLYTSHFATCPNAAAHRKR